MAEDKKRTNGRARQRRARQLRNRRILTTVCLMALVMVVSIGGTIAWLTDKTTAVTNTFTVGDINITLDETKKDFKMVPGSTIDKDPKVTVKAGSEACWLFVKVEESTNLKDFITYTVDAGWNQLKDKDGKDVAGVYYRDVAATANDASFKVLTNDKVSVNDTVTKTMMNDLQKDGATQPTLTFTAYACQKDNVGTAAEAWEKAQPTSGT